MERTYKKREREQKRERHQQHKKPTLEEIEQMLPTEMQRDCFGEYLPTRSEIQDMFHQMGLISNRLFIVRNDVARRCEDKHPSLFQNNETLKNRNRKFKVKQELLNEELGQKNYSYSGCLNLIERLKTITDNMAQHIALEKCCDDYYSKGYNDSRQDEDESKESLANEYVKRRFNREIKLYYSDDEDDLVANTSSSTIPLAEDKKDET